MTSLKINNLLILFHKRELIWIWQEQYHKVLKNQLYFRYVTALWLSTYETRGRRRHKESSVTFLSLKEGTASCYPWLKYVTCQHKFNQMSQKYINHNQKWMWHIPWIKKIANLEERKKNVPESKGEAEANEMRRKKKRREENKAFEPIFSLDGEETSGGGANIAFSAPHWRRVWFFGWRKRCGRGRRRWRGRHWRNCGGVRCEGRSVLLGYVAKVPITI